jgi:hypothetical protein
MSHVQLGAVTVPEPGDAAAVQIPPRDGFSDPPGLAVRADVLAAVGAPEPVRGGALADLVVRIVAAGHVVEARDVPVPPRRATAAALYHEGAARFWLFRRYPERYPLPLSPSWRLPLLALGALRANGRPTRTAARSD